MSNILIVDDQPHLQFLLSEELKDDGYNTASVSDARSAVSYCKESKPDVVLLDLYLDGFEGWNVLNDLKNGNPNLSVIVVTAYDNYANDPRLSRADGYVVKDLGSIDTLRKMIADALKHGPSDRDAIDAKMEHPKG
jgi:CheY-like chemotaxis protein